MQGQVPLAQVTRSGWVESVHAGHAVLVDPDGAVIRSWGRPEDPVLPRSSNKPLQAAGMVGAGLDLAGAQLAIAAASHSGEAFHLDTVRAVLAQGGLTEADLANAPALPYSPAAQVAWIRAGGGPTSLTQNCSGKHAAMLRTALALGAPLTGYLDPGHPVQRAAAAGIERLSGERIVATGVDGCGAPVVAISLLGLARAFSRMVLAGTGTPEGRVARAMSAHPAHVGGTDRDVTLFMAALPGAIAKDGAESVHAFALPDGRAGALKVADGSERARAAVAVALLAHLGVDPAVLAVSGPAPVLGGGRPVGAVDAVI
ncbi:MAG: asparaginase [Candidatus Nanopelagicales bacterium]|jgi:L-asparaginase II|nr:asparaginase [Candidatus Nanopelagicales bacterium]